MEWISVNDMIPAEDVLVLAYDGYRIDLAFVLCFENGKPLWMSFSSSLVDVTHWRPLPKPPNPHRGSSLDEWIEEEGLDV